MFTGDSDSFLSTDFNENNSPEKRQTLPEDGNGVFNLLNEFNIQCNILLFKGNKL